MCISYSSLSNYQEVAQRCFKRLTSPDCSYSDPDSGASLRQLLALCFLATQDGTHRMGSFEDAMEALITGLYEIQRGYNLSADMKLTDDNQKDAIICKDGTFKKLIEKLVGIHPDCKIIYITYETAMIKLPQVVKKEVNQYLSGLQSSAQDFLKGRMKRNGIGEIWSEIKDRVAQRMFDEFGALFESIEDPLFNELIDRGLDVKLQYLCSVYPLFTTNPSKKVVQSPDVFQEKQASLK